MKQYLQVNYGATLAVFEIPSRISWNLKAPVIVRFIFSPGIHRTPHLPGINWCQHAL